MAILYNRKTGARKIQLFVCGALYNPPRANQELSNDIWPVEVCRRKVALRINSHLTPIKAWWRAVSTTSEGRRVSSEVCLENCTQVWGWAKFGQCATHGWEKIVLHTCPDLSKLVRTCLNQSANSDQVRPSRNVIFCTFECFYSSVLRPPAETAYLSFRDRELSNDVWLVKCGKEKR